MTIQTRDFGLMELDEKEVVEFRAPIFGFENLVRFVILSDDEAGPGILWLQSLDDPGVCFILLDPASIGLDYSPEVPGDVAAQLELGGDEPPVILLVAVVPEDFKDTTVNLKSPVVINPAKKCAAQTILDADYPIRFHLFGEGESQC